MRRILLLVICINLFSCKKEIDLVQYKDGRQLLTINGLNRDGSKIKAPRPRIISPDSIVAGEELLAKIFLENTDFEIMDASVGCENDAVQVVDTTTHKVSGCSTGLLVQNDTIFIGFRPSNLGLNEFPQITILTRDKERIFRTINYSFTYSVVD